MPAENDLTYKKWRSLVNMSYGELKKFYNSEEGKRAGLSSSEASKQGIDSGRESARWIMKMKITPKSEWTPAMWKWANKQISFISRMSGNKGGLYDDKGNKTRKHTSLLIWGHNPEKYEYGGEPEKNKLMNTEQSLNEYEAGGALVGEKDGKVVYHDDGHHGGYIEGKRHSEGGVKAINTDTGQPLEVEGGEVQIVPKAVNDKTKREFEGEMLTQKEILSEINQSGGGVPIAAAGGGVSKITESTDNEGVLKLPANSIIITRDAVSDDEKREFEGEMLTNRQILSKINESGGGVSFADGGDVPEKCAYSGREFNYGGKLSKDIDIVNEINTQSGHKRKMFGIKKPDLPPSEANKDCFNFKNPEYGTMRLVNKVVPSLQEFLYISGDVNHLLEKKQYKDYLYTKYDIKFNDLPQKVKTGLLIGNQKLIDNYING